MSSIQFLSQGDLDFSHGPLYSAHPTGNLSLLLLPTPYFLGGGSSLLSSPTPLLPSSLLPPPYLCSPLLPLTPHSAVTWHCARPSTQPKCTGSWPVPVVLPPNRPTHPSLTPHTPNPSFKSTSPPPPPPSGPSPPPPLSPSPPSPPPGFPPLSIPPTGPGLPHPLSVDLTLGINTGKISFPSLITCTDRMQVCHTLCCSGDTRFPSHLVILATPPTTPFLVRSAVHYSYRQLYYHYCPSGV